MEKNNILAVGAHPDDVEIGCAGTLAKHIEKDDNVFVLILTNGEKGNHSPDRCETILALKKLGIDDNNIVFGNFPDGHLRDDQHIVNFIEQQILKFKVNRVYTHSPYDRHQDHRNCSLAVSSAARNVSEIFLFQGPSTKVPFEPHYFIELNENHFTKKIDCLSNYQTQIKKGILNLDWIRQLAGVTGLLHNTNYAEAFAINHLVRKENEI